MPIQESKVEIRKGLKDVHFDRTKTAFIDGRSGTLLYRGFSIHDLAEKSTFEETSYLLLYGSLPNRAELDKFDTELKSARELPDELLSIIHGIKHAHPMDVLRTTVSAMSSLDPDVLNMSRNAVLEKGVRLIASVPSIVAAHYRIRNGDPPIASNPTLSHAANFLSMLFGTDPHAEDSRLIDKDLILHAEHGVNASTFAARVAASTSADYYATITAAISVLKGTKHGGAAEGVITMTQAIGSEENASEYVEKVIANGGRIMGFGHPVYKAVDPRSLHLKAEAEKLAHRKNEPRWFSILQAVTETEALKKRAKLGINPNVDFWAGAIYSLLDIPDDLFVPLFAIGRMPGWTAHVLEQYSKRDILRPRLEYTGEHDLLYVPIEERG
ncbi:MAG: citrate/2-methylcitrate synthase [SAR202 cluster bacterium]|nr:citrate/2-methylcitrate synthase [SAR202 cluster bacterium]